MNIIAIIPARMGSSRFPGKPLADIHGMPMIGHVYLRTRMCPSLSDTYVATCDREIFEYVESIGGKAVMTADTHERCSDRAAEAMVKIERKTGKRIDIVVLVQGDEPLVTPEMIDSSINPMLEDPSVQVVNLMAKIPSVEEFEDPNTIKVVVGLDQNALYFSREPIPTRKKIGDAVSMRKQVCIIPFRRDYLIQFNCLPETSLERAESVDMMRVLEHGGKVRMVMIDDRTMSVDTPEDLKRVVRFMREDPLMSSYH